MEVIIKNTQIHTLHNVENLTAQQCLNKLKQKLPVFSECLRRYQESDRRKQDNALFERSVRTFNKSLNSNDPRENKSNYPRKRVFISFGETNWLCLYTQILLQAGSKKKT